MPTSHTTQPPDTGRSHSAAGAKDGGIISGGPGVSAVVDTAVAFYTLEPVLAALLDRGVRLRVHVAAQNRELVEKRIPSLAGLLLPLEPIKARLARQKAIHRLLLMMLTRSDFSFQFRLQRHPAQHPGDWRYRAMYAASVMAPGLPHPRVNGALSRLLRPITPNLFPESTVVVASRNSFPHALCAAGLKPVTVMESWDHPVKWPSGYRSAAVFAWNKELAEDWREYQGDRDVRVGYPLKLRSWLESSESFWTPPAPDSPRTAVYAAGTSSHSYINRLHEFELRLIEQVCRATSRAGWKLCIKPKPNGKIGDFDPVVQRHPHVSVGTYREVVNPNDYYLDDAYNRTRSGEMAGSSVLINSLTTYGLDAALMGMPVLQLDCRSCPGLRAVAEGQTNHHLERYFLSKPELCLRFHDDGDIETRLSEWLSNPDGRAVNLTTQLRAWLRPYYSLSSSVDGIVDRISSIATA